MTSPSLTSTGATLLGDDAKPVFIRTKWIRGDPDLTALQFVRFDTDRISTTRPALVVVGGAGHRRRSQMRYDFFPDREQEMVAWGRNLLNHLQAAPDHFGFPAETVQAFAVVQERFEAAFARVANPAQRTRVDTISKNLARAAMEKQARKINSYGKGIPTLSDADRITLGFKVPKQRVRSTPAPKTAPVVHIKELGMQTMSVQLRDASNSNTRARPDNAAMAQVFVAVGDRRPVERARWRYVATTSQTDLRFELPFTIELGQRVWVVARWQTRAARTGPWCRPVSVVAGLKDIPTPGPRVSWPASPAHAIAA